MTEDENDAINPGDWGDDYNEPDDIEDWYTEDLTYFDGECTCMHDPDEHGWGECVEVDSLGNQCPCEAGWLV